MLDHVKLTGKDHQIRACQRDVIQHSGSSYMYCYNDKLIIIYPSHVMEKLWNQLINVYQRLFTKAKHI